MRIITARIQNFRNLEEAEFSFSAQVNLFLGGNGQGKTNLLEALNYIALGRSHRGSRNEELIRFGEDHLHVALDVEKDSGERTSYEYALAHGGDRRIRIDGRAIGRRSELVGDFTSVFFAPGSIELVRGGPQARRRFVDRGLASSEPQYLAQLQSYLRVLRQKTQLLRGLKIGGVALATARDELAAWNRELARYAVPICCGRLDYAGRIEPVANQAYGDLAATSSSLEFAYRPRLEAVLAMSDESELEGEILAEFDYIVENEIRRGRPLTGPQLDDFAVRLGDVDLRTFGSQGETRTAAISLILAQSEVVFQKRHVRPVLFFDDIFSELDRDRSRQLQEKSIQHHQIFIATARDEDVAGWRPDGLRVWRIQGGKLEDEA